MANSDAHREQALTDALASRILVVDGAMGTALQACELGADDFGGLELEGCNENLTRTRPDVVLDVHRGYLAAGADIIETNTFGGTRVVLDEYDLGADALFLNQRSAELAVQAVREFGDTTRVRFVAGSMGPTTKAITVTGGISFDQLQADFSEQAEGLLRGGVDLLLVETQQDTRNVKAALLGIEAAIARVGRRVPLMVSGTIEPMGTMLAGQTAEALCASVEHVQLLSLGLNCATGPEFMTDSIRSLAAMCETRISCIPNAGLPDEDGHYQESPAAMAEVLERFADQGWLNIVGGCCGTTPEHVTAFAQMVQGKTPRQPMAHQRSLYSGIDLVEATEDNRPLLVGERTNVIGSRKFKRLIQEEKFDEASEIARLQVKGGAQILDICLADPDRDEMVDMERFLEQVIRKVKPPLMIDSTDPAVIERSLTYCQGKAIINSINLEDGEERFEAVVPLARKFGAALVVGTIDEDPEQGMAVSRQRKLEVAQRSFDLLTQKYGVPARDIIWDPLTFPCATGDENYVGSAVETIEGIRLIKDAFPMTRTILGISNVSFGLPPAGREVLNAVFLYHCTKAGLDMAIVNTQRLERYASIPHEERQLAEDLLFDRTEDPVADFANHFRDRSARVRTPAAEMSLDERLANYIIEGTKEGLVADLDEKRAEASPLEIINGPLMAGMEEVGRLFNDNELIVAEVLQSAEAMKAAVSHLEQFMEKEDSAAKGTVLLATVKGDVHDIGKNLVDIILTNNGYRVVNLGIKIPPEVLIQSAREHRPDAIGLSGLLVKSAQQMVVTATDLHESGVQVPLLVGGAALSPGFTRQRIAPAYDAPTVYAKDAMDGLGLLNRIQDGETNSVVEEQEARFAKNRPAAKPRPTSAPSLQRSSQVSLEVALPTPPDLQRHHEWVADLAPVFALINPQMLYGKHLGFRGQVDRARADGDPKLLKLVEQMESLQREAQAGAMRVGYAWQWFAAESEGNRIHLFVDQGDDPAVTWEFPRQSVKDGLCLSDLVLPPRDGQRDHVCLLVTTAGGGILQQSAAAKEAGEYVRSHGLQALALETAEAAAEHLHRRIRAAWGFADGELTPKEIFQAKYRGKRYSFGYPACPDLAGQAGLFDLLKPDDLGVALTDGFMMDPEASVSALVFHHPDARYFATDASVEVG